MESNEANFEHSRDVVTVDLEDDFQAAVQVFEHTMPPDALDALCSCAQSSDQCCYCPTFRELHKQIDLLRYQLQQERIAREVMTAISARTDRSLAKVLADAWQAVEDEQEARQKVVDQVAALTKERDYFHSLYDLIEVQRRHEMNSAKEAHKELYAIKSQLESIQVDNENLLGQLVKVKVRSYCVLKANTS